MTVKNRNNAVCIIAYKETPSSSEAKSFEQCLKTLSKHELLLIYAKNLNISYYLNIAESHSITLKLYALPTENFKSIQTYNAMMLSEDFYSNFSQYEYILIYQLDAWVFKDDFELWCEKGYAYIGAPFFTNRKELLPYAGNGGFSLRHVQSFRDLLSGKYKTHNWNYDFFKAVIPAKTPFRVFIKRVLHCLFLFFCRISPKLFCRYMIGQEDAVFSLAFNLLNNNNVPNPRESALFSFERFPTALFVMTNKTLPFGCHAFEKYEPEFWHDKLTPIDKT